MVVEFPYRKYLVIIVVNCRDAAAWRLHPYWIIVCNQYLHVALLPGRVTDQRLKCANISCVAHLLHH